LEVTKISGFQIGKNSSLKSKIVSLAGSKLVIILSRIYTNLNTNFTNNGQFAPCEGRDDVKTARPKEVGADAVKITSRWVGKTP
jgi:hypothetical protein